MDAPSLQGSVTLLASSRRLQTYIRPSDARGASALMECAGWFLYNSRLGGGCALAMMCDLIIAAGTACFGRSHGPHDRCSRGGARRAGLARRAGCSNDG